MLVNSGSLAIELSVGALFDAPGYRWNDRATLSEVTIWPLKT